MRWESKRWAEVKVGNWGATGVEVNVFTCSIAAGDTDSLLGLCQKPLGLIQIAAGVVCIATKTSYLIILAGSIEKRRVSVGGRGHRRHPHTTSSMDGMSPCWSYWTNVTAEIQTHHTRKHFQSSVVQFWWVCEFLAVSVVWTCCACREALLHAVVVLSVKVTSF